MNERRILIVDDEPSVRSIFVRALSQAGYVVQDAASAEQALALMRANPAQVLFLDLNLPGMNGLELCRELRKAWPWSIRFAVTGYASMFELVDCREAGFDDYFLKPITLEDLLGAAQQAFAKIDRWQKR